MTSTQNLNSMLSPDPRRAKRAARVEISRTQAEAPIRSSVPPVRIVGVSRRYQGGYRVNV